MKHQKGITVLDLSHNLIQDIPRVRYTLYIKIFIFNKFLNMLKKNYIFILFYLLYQMFYKIIKSNYLYREEIIAKLIWF